MTTLAERIALGLCLHTEVFVFPAWGDAEEVFAHLAPEAFRLILGMSASMWRRVENAYVLRTGKDFNPGDVTLHLMQPECFTIRVRLTPKFGQAPAGGPVSWDAEAAGLHRTVTIIRPKPRSQKP